MITKKAKPKFVKVNVTARKIREGEIENGENCPIALALQTTFARRYVQHVEVSVQRGNVGIDTAYVRLGYRRTIEAYLALPETAQKFIKAFDKGKLVKPFSFNVKNI